MSIDVHCANCVTPHSKTPVRRSRASPLVRPPVHRCARVAGMRSNVRVTLPTTCCMASVDVTKTRWTDDFTYLNDRQDATPVPLPALKIPKRVVLVRHGQSTWNAEGRIQGCSDESVLTDVGTIQAETTRVALGQESFDLLFFSPLQRARRTADIVWDGRPGPRLSMPMLREIDLYSFQGLLKHEGKEKYGSLYKSWQRDAQNFTIDDHAPVRELWYRASLAWQKILTTGNTCSTVLVVAHNAVNQALICTAVGMDPSYFRRLLQSNAATTVIDFQPSEDGGPPRATLNRLNESPDPPFSPSGAGRPAKSRIILVRNGGTASSEAGLLLGRRNEPCSVLGEVHAQKTAELLIDLKCDYVVTSPLQRAVTTAEFVAKIQPLAGHDRPDVRIWDDLKAWDAGEWEMRPFAEVQNQDSPDSAEKVQEFWDRMGKVWGKLQDLVDAEGDKVAVVTGHSSVLSAVLGHCLGLDPEALKLFRHDLGSVTILDFPDGARHGKGVVRCTNYSAHLGRWAVPVTRGEWENVCGIDGCF